MGAHIDELLHTVLQHAPVTLFSLDARGVVTLAEGRGLKLMGKRAADLVGTSARERFAYHPEVSRDIARALAGEEFTAEHKIDGAVLETRYRPLRGPDGTVTGTVGVSVDITARRRAEAERAGLEAQLRQTASAESLGVLAGRIAHDFNNVLAIILANAAALQAETCSASALRQIEDIVTASRMAAQLTRKLLSHTGREPTETRRVDLSEHVGEVARLLQPSLREGVELALDLQPNLPEIEADVAQIQQIVMNLVVNAAEAIGDGCGTVSVATLQRELVARDLQDLLLPGAPQGPPSGPFVVLEVRDTGAGMDPTTRARMFEPFFTTKLRGRGLGLATVLEAVRSHGGVMRVDSSPGRGSRFEVLFPAARGPAA